MSCSSKSPYPYVTYGSTLTIEAGTVIKGDKETRAALIVEPGGKLIARGTVDSSHRIHLRNARRETETG